MKKKFRNINLDYKKTILFAIITGIYTAIVTIIPNFKDTSIQDIGISFEWWILFGIIIITNSKSNKDSALKCLIFFLISQPLVYLLQVPFNSQGFGIFNYYKPWFYWTLLTIPMGYIGYYIKKDNILSLIILTPILLFLGYHEYTFLKEAINFFPNHILSYIFCVVTSFIYILAIFNNKMIKTIGLIICGIITISVIVFTTLFINTKNTTYNTIIKCVDEEIIFDNTSKVYLEDDYGKVYIEEIDFGDSKAYCINAEFKKTGNTKLIIENEHNTITYKIKILRSSYSLELIEKKFTA